MISSDLEEDEHPLFAGDVRTYSDGGESDEEWMRRMAPRPRRFCCGRLTLCQLQQAVLLVTLFTLILSVPVLLITDIG